MAGTKPTYSFYSEQYGGKLDEGGFDAALPHAVSYVRKRIWPNSPEEDMAAYMRAVCAACDVDAAYGFTGGAGSLASVTTGTVNMSFGGNGGGSSWEADMARAADGELVGSGLLFMGMG